MARHRHAVQRVSEAHVSARQTDGHRGAIRSLIQWKDKPDHVFTACDDGTVKVNTHTNGNRWERRKGDGDGWQWGWPGDGPREGASYDWGDDGGGGGGGGL